MERLLKDVGRDIKSASEESRKKPIAAVSAMKKRPKIFKKPKLKYKKPFSPRLTPSSNKVSSASASEGEDIIPSSDTEVPSTLYFSIDNPIEDDDGSLTPPDPENLSDYDNSSPTSENSMKVDDQIIIQTDSRDNQADSPARLRTIVIEDPANDKNKDQITQKVLQFNGLLVQQVTAEQIFVVINFILEIPSAVFDQLSSVHKIQYVLISLVMTIITRLICIAQLVYNARDGRVAGKWKKKIPWLYYPSKTHKPFGCVTEIIGLLFAICQCIFITIEYILYRLHINNPIKISSLPLIFSFCLLCSKFQKSSYQKKTFPRDQILDSNMAKDSHSSN